MPIKSYLDKTFGGSARHPLVSENYANNSYISDTRKLFGSVADCLLYNFRQGCSRPPNLVTFPK